MSKSKELCLSIIVAIAVLFLGSSSFNHISVSAQSTKSSTQRYKLKGRKQLKKYKLKKKTVQNNKATKAKKVTSKRNYSIHRKHRKIKNYQSVDGFNFPADSHPTNKASDSLSLPSNYLFYFDSHKKRIVFKHQTNHNFIKQSMKTNVFHPNSADVNKTVNIKKINIKMQRQLSNYAAKLVNDFRHKLSNHHPYTNDLKVTNRALLASRDVAKGYNKDHWNFATRGNHDVKVLNKVFTKFKYNSYGENIVASLLANSYISGSVTLANVKESIYGAICAMMFDDADSNWGHADNFLGIGFDNSAKQEFGVSIDKMGQIHFEIYQ
ncbi:hypothetical protein AKUH3B101J_00700 [Apilactobacillus kunkeei]|uniref:SEC10/PgrA surface exclusion domain-containing protein n=1 Tax=Apilactobacillus kunkeei TaxID=148814 RepID=UPI002009F5C9|nr:SEC10/PgrA surface exclusion domain-containing protein [Apilactobacillus kunkeei]MCK8635174.1 SEC10/PgrA surface exclusion domain-containing protein [Apilactobacillus kunkeei]CAI2551923.1 hypothetical protein AKUH3B101J_00700 [Apilactobacillus kunkeei]CAI2551987.1 hypothetical protein AKUH3B104J_00700 [Apilactobacillus kunkeei]